MAQAQRVIEGEGEGFPSPVASPCLTHLWHLHFVFDCSKRVDGKDSNLK